MLCVLALISAVLCVSIRMCCTAGILDFNNTQESVMEGEALVVCVALGSAELDRELLFEIAVVPGTATGESIGTKVCNSC